MSIYLGTSGRIELLRQFDGTDLTSIVNTSDVSVSRKRLSFDFQKGQLTTGDQIEITSTDGTALSFISGYSKTSTKRFINVDGIGGIRLYNSFADAINGTTADAIALAVPGSNIPIRVEVQNSDFKTLAQVSNFELNTQRETVDTTTLSEEFRSQLSTLMSGSGSMSCFWEYTGNVVDELPQYLLHLLLRTKVGSHFRARFYLKTASGQSRLGNDEIWYEFEGVLTACALQFTPTEAVEITANFITTGAIDLKTVLTPTVALVQEDSDDLRLDQDGAAKLLVESSDT
tara:strand:+ start:1063 stop:1923 length:861 start_codon:yes stop_codon:yes gene_type:complete